jgi:hypothetical protein
MKQSMLKIYLIALSMVCLPLTAQNMASIEIPSGIAFVYGLDYHPVWYTQLKPTVGFEWANSSFIGKSSEIHYAFIVEQRYYYNMLKRQSKGKNTLNKSANFISLKPAYIFSRGKFDKNSFWGELTGNNRYNIHTYYCTANWGLRRAIGQRFYFDGNIGLGPSYSTRYHEWGTAFELNFNFGFKLF